MGQVACSEQMHPSCCRSHEALGMFGIDVELTSDSSASRATRCTLLRHSTNSCQLQALTDEPERLHEAFCSAGMHHVSRLQVARVSELTCTTLSKDARMRLDPGCWTSSRPERPPCADPSREPEAPAIEAALLVSACRQGPFVLKLHQVDCKQGAMGCSVSWL